jgi:hypothetical protein
VLAGTVVEVVDVVDVVVTATVMALGATVVDVTTGAVVTATAG